LFRDPSSDAIWPNLPIEPIASSSPAVSIGSRIDLLVLATRVMNVIVAEPTAQGEAKMKMFTIDAENNITTHASRKAARDTGAGVFSTEEQFADLIGPDNKRLLEIWNSLPGVKPVAKFANRKAATARIWETIQRLGVPAASEPAPEHTTDATDAGPIPEVKTPFDLVEAQPDPVASEHQASIESAALRLEDQPSTAPGEPPETTAAVSAQVPDVAPTATKASKKATRTAKPAKAQKATKTAKSQFRGLADRPHRIPGPEGSADSLPVIGTRPAPAVSGRERPRAASARRSHL